MAGNGARGRHQENSKLIRQIAELLHEYTEEEVERLAVNYLANPPKVKYKPRGRSAKKNTGGGK